jgi:hypothetical protein
LDNVNQTIQYFDGLGKPIQTVQVQGSATGRDLAQPMAYDQFEREPVKYLPYSILPGTASDGSYKTTAIADQASFYANPGNAATWSAPGVSTITSPTANTNFEPSPLNRVLERGAPGDPWQLTGTPGLTATPGHTSKIIYGSNDAANLTTGTGRWARIYTVNIDPSTGARTLIDNGSTGYGVNQLDVTISQDENWTSSQGDARLNTTETYKDKEGHVVLKRTYNYTTVLQTLSTYYVYDDFGNLSFVLPPASGADAGLPSQTTLNALCYQYNYDEPRIQARV